MSKKTLSAKALVGYQYPDVFDKYHEEIFSLVENDKRNFIWSLVKVFLFGRIIGIRDERARRKRIHTK